MKPTPEQLLMILGEKGALGPTGFLSAVPNDNVTRVIQVVPVTSPKAYMIPTLLFFARNPANGQIAVQQWQVIVHGDPTAPAVLLAAAIAPATTDMANPPVFTVVLVGTNLELRVTNPIAGAPVDVADVTGAMQLAP